MVGCVDFAVVVSDLVSIFVVFGDFLRLCY